MKSKFSSAAILGLLVVLPACATTGQSDVSREFVVHFNEPFITFESEGSQLLRRSPEDQDGRLIATRRSMQGAATRFEWEASDGKVWLLITPGQCFDDMAGSEYSHKAQLNSENYAGFMGCARLTSESQPREPAS